MAINCDILVELIDETLESARLEITKRLLAAGLPLTLTIDQTSLTHTGDGYRSSLTPRSVSGLNDFRAQLAVADDSVQFATIGLRDQLEPLAEYLAENSPLGDKQPHGMWPHETGSDGVLVRVAIPLALHYLTTLEDVGEANSALVSQLSSELEALATSKKPESAQQLAIAGIQVSEPDGLEYQGVRLRPLTDEEMGTYVQENNTRMSHRSATPPTDFIIPREFNHFIPTTVVEIREEVQVGGPASPSNRLAQFTLACFLSNIDIASSGIVVRFGIPQWVSQGYMSGNFPVKNHRHRGYKLVDADRFEEIVDLSMQIPDFSGAESSQADIVFHRVLQGVGSDDSGFLDFVIALESALLQGIRQELRYRFALYGALFLRDSLPPEDTFRKLKKVYDVRSSVVHGSKVKSSDRAAVEKDAEVLARAVALQVVREGWPNHEELDKIALTLVDNE